jgi:HEAT repeat protein
MLCAYIADRSVWIRKGIVDALQEMQAVDELFGLLSHRDPVTRVHAAQVLGRLKDPRAQDPRVYEALCRALQSEHSGQIRNGFIEVCQRMKAAEDPRAFDVLCLALRTNDWLIRRSAARELGSYGDRRAVPFLTPLLKDPASTVRHVSAWAIRDLGGSGAADALAVETDSSIWWYAEMADLEEFGKHVVRPLECGAIQTSIARVKRRVAFATLARF